jgi:hypothetical protein
LIDRHAGIREVLVQHKGGSHPPRGQAPKVGRRIPVHVEDTRPPRAGESDEIRKQAGIEAPASEVADGDALLGEEARGGFRFLEPAQGNHQEKSRETPWMLEPATPNLSQT